MNKKLHFSDYTKTIKTIHEMGFCFILLSLGLTIHILYVDIGAIVFFPNKGKYTLIFVLWLKESTFQSGQRL